MTTTTNTPTPPPHAPGHKVIDPVESQPSPGQNSGLPPGKPDRATVARFNGLAGGRPRTDGLIPGSPEAKEADRKKATDRKAAWRARLAAQNPAPLPSQGPSILDPNKAPDDGPTLDADSQVVPWDTDTLRPLLDEIIPQVEAEAVAYHTGKALEAKLPAPLLKEIEKDARWSPAAKTALSVSGSQVAAKWLNKMGVSAENRAEVVLAMALLSIGASNLRLARRLDTLIEQRKHQGSPIPPAANVT